MGPDIVSASDPTFNDAMAALSALEAEDSPPSQPESAPSPETPDSAPIEQPAPAQPETPEVPTPDPAKETGTPATEESPSKEQSPEQGKQATEPSRYEKNRTRQEKSWDKLNQEKADTRAYADALKRDREAFDRERADFVRKQAAANKPKYGADDYDRHSLQLEGKAAQLEREAKKLEDDGKFEAAEAKREEAIANKVNSKNAKEYASQLRANPPQADPTEKEVNDKFKADQKEWWTKAAIDFPNAAKQGTPEAEAIKAALTPGHPQFNQVAYRFVESFPEGLYHLADLINSKSSAARVPTLETEIGQLRAKVKELSEKLTPSTESVHGQARGTPEFSQMTGDQQFAELTAMAEQMDRR